MSNQLDAPDWYRQELSQTFPILPKTALAATNNFFAAIPSGGCPPGYRSMVLVLSLGNHATSAKVTAITSDVPLLNLFGFNGGPIGQGYWGMPYISELDPQVQVSIPTSAAGGFAAIYAFPESEPPVPAWVSGGGPASPGGIVQVGGITTEPDALGPFITDPVGQQYVVAAPASASSGNHPPNDLTTVSVATATAGGTLVASPGSGNRLRVFRVHAVPAGVPTTAYSVSVDGIEGQTVPLCLTTTGGNLLGPLVYEAPPSGQPTPANTALTNHATLNNTWTFTITYTSEAV